MLALFTISDAAPRGRISSKSGAPRIVVLVEGASNVPPVRSAGVRPEGPADSDSGGVFALLPPCDVAREQLKLKMDHYFG